MVCGHPIPSLKRAESTNYSEQVFFSVDPIHSIHFSVFGVKIGLFITFGCPWFFFPVWLETVYFTEVNRHGTYNYMEASLWHLMNHAHFVQLPTTRTPSLHAILQSQARCLAALGRQSISSGKSGDQQSRG